MKVSPFIKWVGGKRKALSKYSSLFPSAYNRYFEPFLGGGAVFFGLNQSKNAILSDINEELINAYECVKKYPQKVSDLLEEHSTQYCEEYYYILREENPQDHIEKAARFIFLNKSCHGGLYRLNSSQKFNVSWGKFKSPAIPKADSLKIASSALKDAKLICGSFADIILEAEENDFVFCDPPYLKIEEEQNTSINQLSLDLGIKTKSTQKNQMFTQYTADGFSIEKHTELRDLCLKLSQKGVLIAIANSDCEYTRELYKDFSIHSLEVTHAINRDVEGRKTPVKEILVTSW